jgi:hypothetical protein
MSSYSSKNHLDTAHFKTGEGLLESHSRQTASREQDISVTRLLDGDKRYLVALKLHARAASTTGEIKGRYTSLRTLSACAEAYMPVVFKGKGHASPHGHPHQRMHVIQLMVCRLQVNQMGSPRRNLPSSELLSSLEVQWAQRLYSA